MLANLQMKTSLVNYGGDDMNFIKKYIEDILIFSGLTLMVGTTFLLSKIAGLYCLSVVLLSLGVYFAKNPPERG